MSVQPDLFWIIVLPRDFTSCDQTSVGVHELFLSFAPTGPEVKTRSVQVDLSWIEEEPKEFVNSDPIRLWMDEMLMLSAPTSYEVRAMNVQLAPSWIEDEPKDFITWDERSVWEHEMIVLSAPTSYELRAMNVQLAPSWIEDEPKYFITWDERSLFEDERIVLSTPSGYGFRISPDLPQLYVEAHRREMLDRIDAALGKAWEHLEVLPRDVDVAHLDEWQRLRPLCCRAEDITTVELGHHRMARLRQPSGVLDDAFRCSIGCCSDDLGYLMLHALGVLRQPRRLTVSRQRWQDHWLLSCGTSRSNYGVMLSRARRLAHAITKSLAVVLARSNLIGTTAIRVLHSMPRALGLSSVLGTIPDLAFAYPERRNGTSYRSGLTWLNAYLSEVKCIFSWDSFHSQLFGFRLS